VILCPSADLSAFADTWMRAVFQVRLASFPLTFLVVDRSLTRIDIQSGGQNCIGAERFIVHSSLYANFTDMMAARIKALKLGDVLSPESADQQVDVGAMVTDRLFDRLEGLIAQAVKGGAKCLVGGRRASDRHGHYFEPTLLVDV
jgi:acyl-CoA reductase-like NAD-dependent aldehyde dehydrogenase